jgi:toxin ParE1/3/4
MKFALRPAARRDILRQFEYYAVEKGSEAAGTRFITHAENAIELICSRPGIGAPKALRSPSLAGLRSWPVTGFSTIRIYYLVEGGTVRVVRVLHGKRDIDALLEEG